MFRSKKHSIFIATGQGMDLMRKLVIIIQRMRQTERELLRQRRESTDLKLEQFNMLFNLMRLNYVFHVLNEII